MTHDQLIEVARRWLRKSRRCPVVVSDLVSKAGETPDAIGWTTYGISILIECKASRADFLADAKKSFRVMPEKGIGAQRFYLAPSGLLTPEEIPDGWGLLGVTARTVNVEKHSKAAECYCYRSAVHDCEAFPRRSIYGETAIFVSLIRRLSGVGLRGKAVLEVEPYTLDEHGREVCGAQLLIDAGTGYEKPFGTCRALKPCAFHPSTSTEMDR